MIRKVLAEELKNLDVYLPDLGCTVGEELLRPTRIYVKPLLHVIGEFGKDIKGISHITGGGFYENVPRMLPNGVRARIEVKKIPEKPIFNLLAQKGSIPVRDMYNTFNMGVGLVIAVSANRKSAVAGALRAQGETPIVLGQCERGEKGVDLVW